VKLFDDLIKEIREFIEHPGREGQIRMFPEWDVISWASGGKRNIVLKPDVGVELGNPSDESASFLVWTNNLDLVQDGAIRLEGPDIGECENRHIPFGKIVLIGGRGFDEENCCERCREMELLRYDLSLEGYMIRAVSQYMREWSRVSKKAVAARFSFATLGDALIKLYKSLEYIDAVEVFFVSSSPEAVRRIRGFGEQVMRCIGAMRKLSAPHLFDCDSCEYRDVCDDVSELRAMRNAMKKTENAAQAN
jgi:CO dehydrogenase/acetyl-CoA synthase beta subunit